MRLRIVLVGAVEFSAHCLATLFDLNANVVSILGLDSSIAARDADYADLSLQAAEAGIPFRAIRSINDPDALAYVAARKPDLLMVLGWSEILRPPALAIAKLGTIGSHPTLLPAHRGHHPIIWALVNDLEESGVTLFWMTERVDQGRILAQRAFTITPEDDARSVYEKVKQTAAVLLRESLPLIEAGNAPRQPQDETHASYWRKRSPKDGEICWTASTHAIGNLVRALTRPYPGATTRCGDVPIVVWKARAVEHADPNGTPPPPGTVIAVDGPRMRVVTGDGAIDLLHTEGLARAPQVGERLG